MKANQISEEERRIHAWLLNQTRPELKRHRCKVFIASIAVSLIVLGVMIWYWIRPTVAYGTSLSAGGQLYALWGALLLVLGAMSNPATLALMSMTRLDGNPKLFLELMKSRFNAIIGVCFIVGGFSIQASSMLVFGS